VSVLTYLEQHLPTKKALAILDYASQHNCTIKVTRPRKTKLGDFRRHGHKQSISVNKNTNSFRFLLTLIHELAHLETFVMYNNKVQPHGLEWKHNFKKLYNHFDMDEEFSVDKDVLRAVHHELENPKACSGVNASIERSFAKYDEDEGVFLDQLSEGDLFMFRNQQYEKLETRRTRVMCLNLKNKRKYLISIAAKIQKMELR